MLGDINIDALDKNNPLTMHYNNLLESYGYVNEISLPTHVNQVTNMDGSCLDHIVHNLHFDAESYVLSPNISDHYAVAMCFPFDITLKSSYKVSFRDYSQSNIDKFKLFVV